MKRECKYKVILTWYRYDDEYYYDDGKFPWGQEAAGQMMPGEEEEEFDSDDALFFDNNDLANRIWEDGDWNWYIYIS